MKLGRRPADPSIDGTVGVFVLDDHQLVRDGLRAVLDAEDDLQVVGEAADMAHTLDEIRRCRPDVAVIDLRPGDGNGIEVCRDVVREFPDIRCVILTSLESDLARIEAYHAGAVAFVVKQLSNRDIVQAIREVADGHRLLDDAEYHMAERRLRNTDEGLLQALTRQELRILRLIGTGQTNREIAAEMGLSPTTVKNYVSNLLAKLAVPSRAGAAALAGRVEAHALDF